MTHRRHVLALLTVTTVMLIPSVAFAGPLEELEGPLKQVMTTWLNIWHGLLEPLLGPYRDTEFWGYPLGWPLSIFCSVLTIIGLIRIHPIAAKVVGGFGGFLQLPIAVAVAYLIFGIAKGIFMGFVSGMLHQYLWGWVADFLMVIVGIAFVWGIIKYIFGEAKSIIKALIDFVKAQILPPLQGNANLGHMILGGILVSGGINQHWIGSVLGCSLGVFTLLFVDTKIGQGALDKKVAQLKGEPRASDGAFQCINEGQKPLLVAGQPVNDENGQPRMISHRCKGPLKDAQGKLIRDAQGKPYNGWNPKDAPKCLSDICDYPNPYWYKCLKCKYAGEDGMGFRRGPKCPKCAEPIPPLPAPMGFHAPGEDTYHAGTPGAAAAPDQPAVVAGTPPAPAPQTQTTIRTQLVPTPADPMAGLLTGPQDSQRCEKCKLDHKSWEQFCTNCGEPLGSGLQLITDAQPASEQAPKAAPASKEGNGDEDWCF